ncbi:MAG: hypothetical protein JW765_12560 [Deltaproteobacteria bacterium]|nr:hypothetical protein [Candidatus Zymogenaceae bacterium]
MLKSLFFVFVAFALTSVYIQTADLEIKQISSPLMAGLVAICAVVGLVKGRIKAGEGIVFITAWALAACGDAFFEMSRLSATPEDAGKFFVTAVAIFLMAYLIFGVSFNIYAAKTGPRTWMVVTAVAVSVIMGVLAYKSLLVPPGQGALIVVYSTQAIILLCGGLLCLMSGRFHFGCIGILLFFSDWLVGLRAFGNPDIVPLFVTEHVLILILVTYYIPMMASIDYSFKLGSSEK